MLKGFFKKIGRKAARKDMDEFLAFVQSGTDSEMAMMLCATGMARELLRTADSFSRPFPEDVVLGVTAVNEEVSVDLSLYILEINSVRKKFNASENEQYQFISSGLGVFVQTIRALQDPELFARGRSFWKELQRGADGFEEAMMKIRPDLDESGLRSFRPTPNMLAPE